MNLQHLPVILLNEIQHPRFKDSGKQVDVLNKIVRMLGVNFIDEEERKISASEWISFLQEYKLTAPEIIEAYNMTLKRQLRNERNEVIRLFPNLSLISAGEIMEAFIQFKKNSHHYQSGKEALKELMNPVYEPSEEELEESKKKDFEKYIQDVRDEKPNVERRGFLFFKWLFDSGKLKDVLPSKEELKALRQAKMKELIKRESNRLIFYSLSEIKALKKMVADGEELPVSNYVVQQIRDEIVLKYVNKLK